jgi:hypothetical protein
MSLVIGIDPGLSGALACLSTDDGSILACSAMPVLPGKVKQVDAAGLARVLSGYGRDHGEIAAVLVEQVGPDDLWGAVQCFRFGHGVGVVAGVVGALGLPFDTVSPARWRKAIVPGAKPGKDDTIAWAARRFPSLRLTERPKVRQSGLADAAAIAEFGRRQLVGAAPAGEGVAP